MNRNPGTCFLALLAVALLLAPAAVQAAKAPSHNDHLRLSPPDAEALAYYQGDMRVSAKTGAPIALYGLRIPMAADTPEAMASQYLNEAADLLRIPPFLDGLSHHATRSSKAGHTVRFRQHYQGIPVMNSEVTVTISPWNEVNYVLNGFKPDVQLASTTPSVSASTARAIVIESLGLEEPFSFEDVGLRVYDDNGTWKLVQRVEIVPRTAPFGNFVGLVDALSGDTLRLWDTSHYGAVNGTGSVFDPDPLSSAQATYGDTGFVDGGDATTPQLDGETFTRNLLDIDETGGTHTLIGPYAAIVDTEAPFNGLYGQGSSSFAANRSDDLFEAVNTYYHIDTVMRYINVDLGITIAPFQYSGGARFDPHGLNGADNSHYTGGNGVVAFGEGCVDDAEDADVVVHELGHALHDWVTNGGLSQVNGLSEGIGDFVAQSYSRDFGHWTMADPEYDWVFHWDGHNVCWGGRRTDYGATYPGGLVGQVHADGQIWSTCMMTIWDDIGRDLTEAAHWEGIGMTNGSSNQNDAASAVMQAAINMGYSLSDQQAIFDNFSDCGYTVPGVSVPAFFADGFESGNTSAWDAVATP